MKTCVRSWLVLGFTLVACGDNRGVDPDASSADASPADAPPAVVDARGPGSEVPDAAVDAGPSVHRQYVVSALLAPMSDDTPLQLDIDGDGNPDNKLRLLVAVLASAGGVDVQGALDRSVARGRTIVLADVESAGGSATLRFASGATPDPAPCASATDTVCRRHLQGTGRFTIPGDADRSGKIDGSIASGAFSGGPGTVRFRVAIRDRVLDVPLVLARAKIASVTDDGLTSGVVGGAISTADLEAKVLPFMATLVADQVRADCNPTPPPDCGCRMPSTGHKLLTFLDKAPVDCAVTLAEVATNPFLQTLLGPDLDVLPADGTPDAISVGFGVTAVKGSWPE